MSLSSSRLEQLPRSLQFVLALCLVGLAAFPFVATDFYASMVARMMILGIFAMSLDLLQGVTGLVSLGHAAYFGLAGYALAFLTPEGNAVSLWWTLPVAVAASGLAALVTFYLAFHAKKMDPRPEDRKEAEVVDGAGELGFFPPYSWWPLWCAMCLAAIALGVAVGWWLFIIGLVLGAVALSGLIFEYYRGEHAH